MGIVAKVKKQIMTSFLYAACAGMVWAAAVLPAYAQAEGMRIGKSILNGAVSVKGEYNDNIYWASKDETDDYIVTVTPALDLKWENSPGNFLNMGYAVDIASYVDYSDNNFARHQPYLGFGLKTPAGLYFTVDERYIHTEDPYGSDNEYGLGLSTKRWNNKVAAAAGFNFAQRYGVEAGYANYLERWDETFDKWQNVDENTYSAMLFYQITAKTRLFGQYQLVDVAYDDQNDGIAAKIGPAWSSATSQDNRQNNLFIGARFSPQNKISGEAKLGYGNVRHDNDVDRTGVKYEDDDTWVAQTRINYQIRTRTRLGFVLSRSYRVTSDEAGDAPGYFDTRAGITLDQEMMHRLTGSLGFEWNTQDYQKTGVEKYFNLYTWKAGLGYDINRWLNAGLYYQYKTKTATEDIYEGSEYTVNSVYVTATAKY
jgi:hypothetical protein